MRAVIGIIRARRDQFDRIGAEDREIADVLIEHLHRERVVGIHLRTVSQLMAAQTQAGSSRHLQSIFNLQDMSALHAHVPQ